MWYGLSYFSDPPCQNHSKYIYPTKECNPLCVPLQYDECPTAFAPSGKWVIINENCTPSFVLFITRNEQKKLAIQSSTVLTVQLKTRLHGNAKYLMPSIATVKASYSIKSG